MTLRLEAAFRHFVLTVPYQDLHHHWLVLRTVFIPVLHQIFVVAPIITVPVELLTQMYCYVELFLVLYCSCL